MAYILKLKRHNKEKEIEFELRFLLSLSTKERFQMMFNKSNEIRQLLGKNEYRRTTQIIKRT